MTTLVRERTGTLIRLPNDPPMNSGGEGQIYRLSPDECVKVFRQPLKEHDVEKIHYLSLVHSQLPGFAWPIEPVRPVADSATCGFVMPLIGGETLDDIIDNGTIPKRLAIELCIEVARLVRDAHAFRHAGIVLGDVLKGANLMIDGGRATFIDCASVSILNLRYRNGSTHDSINRFATPGNTAPERIVDPQRMPDQGEDLFALAVLLFELLFGMPPYKPKPSPATIGFDPDEYVTKGYFFRFVQVAGLEAPTYPPIKLPYAIDTLFRRALLTDNRPSAAEWVQGMTAWADLRRLAQPQPQPKPRPQPAPQPGSWHTPAPNIPPQGPVQPVFGHQPFSPGPGQQQPGPSPATPFMPQPPIQPQPPGQPVPPVQPQPIFNPQPPPVQPGGWRPPQTTAPLLVPIRQPKPPIRIPLPSPQLLWLLCFAVPRFVGRVIRGIFALPAMIITGIVDAFVDLVEFVVDTYLRLGKLALRVGFVLFLSVLTYRVASADLDIVPHTRPSSSFAISHLLQKIFGPDGYVPISRYRNRNSYANDPEYPYDLPSPPSKDFGPSNMDQVLR